MTDPTVQHLYVMQNEFGCIKIGRSVDPWHRRYALRQSELCSVELIAAYEGGGEDEESIHLQLNDFRLEGEWFDGSDATRDAIAQIFGSDVIQWRFVHDPVGAEKWLAHLRVARAALYIKRRIYREISFLRRLSNEPSWISDGGIFQCRYLAETGNNVWIMVSRQKDGTVINTWTNPKSGKREVVPAYTANTEEALLAWPDDLRPLNWPGSPIECCIAALTAIRNRLPKVTRLL